MARRSRYPHTRSAQRLSPLPPVPVDDPSATGLLSQHVLLGRYDILRSGGLGECQPGEVGPSAFTALHNGGMAAAGRPAIAESLNYIFPTIGRRCANRSHVEPRVHISPDQPRPGRSSARSRHLVSSRGPGAVGAPRSLLRRHRSRASILRLVCSESASPSLSSWNMDLPHPAANRRVGWDPKKIDVETTKVSLFRRS